MNRFSRLVFVLLSLLTLQALAPVSAQDAPAPVTLTLVGYAVPREAFGDVIPLFQAFWQKEHNQQVIIQESYGASGSQSRAVVGGFEADIVALSIEPDVTRIADAGLITHDWKANAYQGFVADSVVVLVVRPDNPKAINGWADIVKEGVEVITPDPATSGGAQWNILAALGAVRHGQVEGFEASDAGVQDYLSKLIPNLAVLDKDGRSSFLTFENGIGDVAITYENEAYAGLIKGGEYKVIYPQSTLLIENPVALVDTYVDKHGKREVAQGFLDFLWSAEAQRAFAQNGYRPSAPGVAAEFGTISPYATPEAAATAVATEALENNGVAITFPAIADLFTVAEFGGWPAARKDIFGDGGLYPTLTTQIKGS